MSRSLFLVPALASLFALIPLASAQADQCAYLEARVAQRAKRIIQEGDRIVSYCEPCGDAMPTDIQVVYKVQVGPTGYGQTQEVFIDGPQEDNRPLDLAYTFIEQEPGIFVNLAKLTGCPARGVSDSLTLEPEPKPEPKLAKPVLAEAIPVELVEPVKLDPSPQPLRCEPAPAPAVQPRDAAPGWLYFLMGAGLVGPLWGLVIVGFPWRRE